MKQQFQIYEIVLKKAKKKLKNNLFIEEKDLNL